MVHCRRLSTHGHTKEMVADETSKAFRASIGRLRDHEIKLLHRWALQHCAMCAVLCGSKGTIVLVALKDTARTASSFARTIPCAAAGQAGAQILGT